MRVGDWDKEPPTARDAIRMLTLGAVVGALLAIDEADDAAFARDHERSKGRLLWLHDDGTRR